MEKLERTSDFDRFIISETNRPLDLKRHEWLRLSLATQGFDPTKPINVRKVDGGKLLVMDGQHRLTFCKTLGIPVYFVASLKSYDLAMDNRSVVKWNPSDYAASFAGRGNVDYQELLQFCNEFSMPIGVSAAMMAGTVSFTNVSGKFMDGTWQIKDRDYAYLVARVYVELAKSNRRVQSVRLIEALMQVCRVKDFDHERLLRRVSVDGHLVVQCPTQGAYLEMIERTYNYRAKEPFPLKIETEKAMRARNVARTK